MYLIAVTIRVIDVPEGPVFAADSTTRHFRENTPPGRNIGPPVTATDDDGDPLVYTLLGPDAASFDLVRSTGQLRTRAGVGYDYETRSSYRVTVRAADPSGAGDTIAVAVSLTDVPEKPGTPLPPRLQALAGSGSVLRVRWTEPARRGGPPITGYDLEYRQGSSGSWIAWPHVGTSTTRLLTGLRAGAEYQARVRALNGELPSDWSGPGGGRTNVTVNAWLARFARAVAQGMLEGVEDRLRSPRPLGMRATVAGRSLAAGQLEDPLGTDYQLAVHRVPGQAPSTWGGSRTSSERPRGPRLLTGDEFLTASSFELSGESPAGGVFGAWGRGGFSRFDGIEDRSALDGDITAGTLGADYVKGPWLAGLALSHNWGVGTYGGPYRPDDIEALLTGLYPYAGYRITDRFAVWGVGGYGQGFLTLTPAGGASMETGISLAMAALAARGVLMSAPNGLGVALRTDGFWVRATAEEVFGLLAADVTVTRLRLAVESSYAMDLHNGGMLTPKLEVGVRHDDGDAETGAGLDVGGGLVWFVPARGISVEVEARGLVGHQVEEFRDWGLSGRLRYDRTPSSDRGLSASLRSSVGRSPWGGPAAALWGDTLPQPALHDGTSGDQLSVEAAYGFPILAGRFTGSPWMGAGALSAGRDYRVGYRITSARPSRPDMLLGVEGLRRENGSSGSAAEHALRLRLAMRW